MSETALPTSPQDEDDSWPDDLEQAAAELLEALRWQLGMLRLNYLRPVGWEARRAVFAARGRIFTAITGVGSPQPYVIARALALATASTASTASPSSAPPPTDHPQPAADSNASGPALDDALTASMREWAGLDLGAFWSAAIAYAQVSTNVLEHIMLLTYLEAIVVSDGTVSVPADAPSAVAVVAAVTQAATSDDPVDIYSSCSQLMTAGFEASKSFTIDVALLALASAAPAQN